MFRILWSEMEVVLLGESGVQVYLIYMYTNLFHILGDAKLWEVNMIIKETPEYNVYQNKDGRTRVYIK